MNFAQYFVRCDKCGEANAELLRTAYGDRLCEDCWDEYICSDAGKLEYLIGICCGDLPLEEFDADFLCSVAKSWIVNNKLLNLTDEQRAELEEKAKELGIL